MTPSVSCRIHVPYIAVSVEAGQDPRLPIWAFSERVNVG